MIDLYQEYKNTIEPKLMKELNCPNIMAVPRLQKIVINCGLGEALTDKGVIDKMAKQIAIIVGQKPQVNRAKKSISTFKLREGDAIGLKATLRRKRMYDFFLRLTSIALPRVRDFHGVPKSGFDGRGNYTLGIAEQTIFPELEYSLIDKVRGFSATFVTTAKNDHEAKLLLEALGMPFEKG